MNSHEAAQLWNAVHADIGEAEASAEIDRLESIVFSRAGSTEPVVDFIDPVTGDIVHSTPSQLRLNVLLAARTARRTQPDPSLGLGGEGPGPGPGPAGHTASVAEKPAAPLASTNKPNQRRRLLVGLGAAAVIGIGLVAAFTMTHSVDSAVEPAVKPAVKPEPRAEADPLRYFDYPELFDGPAADLDERFRPESLRNISGTSHEQEGFGVYLGRETDSDLYCLIVQADADRSAFTCGTAEEVAENGLTVTTPVTIRSFVAVDAPIGDTEVTARVTGGSELTLSYPPTENQNVSPPATLGTTLVALSSGPGNETVSADIDTGDDGIIVALACVGDGRVTVSVGEVSYLFTCLSGDVQYFQNIHNRAQGAVVVVVTPVGDATWGLTIAGIPLTTR